MLVLGYRVSLYLRSTPHPVTVTTRIITFLVGNPYKPSFATVTGWGVDLSYTVIPTATSDESYGRKVFHTHLKSKFMLGNTPFLTTHCLLPTPIWVFPKIGGKPPKMDGLYPMENPIRIHDLGVPLFLETPNINAQLEQV